MRNQPDILAKINEDIIEKIDSMIDHTNLKPYSTQKDLVKTCHEVLEYGFYGCCIPPWFIKEASNILQGSAEVVTVIGFPAGYTSLKAKVVETQKALEDGASEIDMVINVSAFKSKKYDLVAKEIATISDIVHDAGGLLKVIIETGYLSEEEIGLASRIVAENGGDFVKTSTGFGPRGALPEDILIIRRNIPDSVKIKAAGGIRTGIQAFLFYTLGVERIGTSSGVRIIEDLKKISQLSNQI